MMQWTVRALSWGMIIAAVPATVLPQTRLLTEGDGPNIALGPEGDLHVIYLKSGTYRYRVYDMSTGELSSERNSGFGVQYGSLDRGYGHIEVDRTGGAHIFTGMGYAYFAPGSDSPHKKSFDTRDPAMAMDGTGRVLLVMRGKDLGCEYCGEGVIYGAIREPGASAMGAIFNLDKGLNCRNENVYPGAAAGPDNSFHVVFRHGPQDKVWYLTSKDGASWSGGAVPIDDAEGPRITVSSKGRVIACSATGKMVERSSGSWVSRGNPVGGEERSQPSLAADRSGNVYATHGGYVAVLRDGSNTWGSKRPLERFARRREHDQSVHMADGRESGTYVIYEGSDGIYVASVGGDGEVGGLGATSAPAAHSAMKFVGPPARSAVTARAVRPGVLLDSGGRTFDIRGKRCDGVQPVSSRATGELSMMLSGGAVVGSIGTTMP